MPEGDSNLTPEQMDETIRLRAEMRKRFDAVPETGKKIEYLGK